jgi:hypothetical protein
VGRRCRSFGWDRINRDPMSQQVWHEKQPSLLKAISARHRCKFAALSPVMLTATRYLKNSSCSYKHSNKHT